MRRPRPGPTGGGHRGPPAVTALLAALALLAGSAPAGAQEAAYTASVFVARATAPGISFDNVYVFNSVDLSGGPWRFTLSVPFVRQRVSTDESVDPASGTLVPAAETTATGLGDPLARVDVTLVNDRARALQVSAAGSVKLPVADSENGLGTGKADVAIGGSVFKALGRTSVLADALFWKYGDPEGLDFEDAVSYSVGVGQLLGDGRWSALVSVSGFTAGIAGLSPPVQLNLGLLTIVGRRHSLVVTTGIGLTDGSTDFSIGTSLRLAR